MSDAGRSEIDKYLLGVSLLAALVLGGGTTTRLITDTAVQLLAILTSTIVIVRHMDRAIDARVFWLMVAAGAAILFQLLPVSFGLVRATQGILPTADTSALDGLSNATVSLGPGRTLEVAAIFSTLCLFSAAVLKLRRDQVFALIPFFLAGVLLNLTAGLIQFSFADRAMVEGVFPYDIWGGFFSNPNHFSTLIFISIPLAFSYLLYLRSPLLLALYLVFALLVLLAAGSTAGVGIGLAITVISAALHLQRNRIGILTTLAGAVVVGVFAVGVWFRVQREGLQLDIWRAEAAQTTFAGFLDNLPFGIGYGNFVTAYPSYERTEMIFDNYINHAHNDYLELLFEGGLLAAALLLALAWILIRRISETLGSQRQMAAALAIIFILVHSLVDYPLRTLAIAFSFAMLVGMLFHREQQSRSAPVDDANIRFNGEILEIPKQR